MSGKPKYNLNDQLLGACNCNWGCPCNFEEPPTGGFCEGMNVWHVETGQYAGVRLDGTTFATYNRFASPVHLGNTTGLALVYDRSPMERRPAIGSMIQNVSPFSVFMNPTANFLWFRYLPFDLRLDGIKSSLRIPGAFEIQLGPMKNTVTGEDEPATLNKPMGFTSKVQKLCPAESHSFNADGMPYVYNGKYGEFSSFEHPIS